MKNLRRYLVMCLILALAMVYVVGCSGANQPAPDTEEPEGEDAGEVGDTIKVGVVLPFTGPNAPISRDHLNGFKLAIDEANERGGVLGRQVELIMEDDRSTPAESVSAVRKLITQDNAIAVLGPFNSSCALAARDVTKEAGIPQLLVGAAADHVVVGYPNVFRLGSNNSKQTLPFVEWLVKEKGKKNVAIIFENTDWGRDLAEVSEEVAVENGATIVLKETFNPGEVDFASSLTKIKAAAPDLIIAPALVNEAAIMARQAVDLGLSGSLFAGWGGWSHGDLPDLAGGAEEGALAGDTYWPDDPDNPVARHVSEQIRALYPDPVVVFHAQAYAAGLTLIDALERAGTTDSAALIKAIAETRIEGPQGPIEFDEEGQNIHIPIVPMAWQNGKLEVIDTPYYPSLSK